MAKKLAEEAIEVVIDAVNGETEAVVRESADLLYNLTVLWASAGVRPEDVWREMERREDMLGIAEKLPKSPVKLPKASPPRMRAATNCRARRPRRCASATEICHEFPHLPAWTNPSHGGSSRAMLRRIYDWCIDAAHKPYALWIMGAVAFAESSFFPVPPDMMLIPMSLARPQRAWLYAGGLHGDLGGRRFARLRHRRAAVSTRSGIG